MLCGPAHCHSYETQMMSNPNIIKLNLIFIVQVVHLDISCN